MNPEKQAAEPPFTSTADRTVQKFEHKKTCPEGQVQLLENTKKLIGYGKSCSDQC